MSEHDYGPPQTFEITWMSGHVEKAVGHQVTWPGSTVRFVHIHGSIDGQWRLVLQAREDDIRTIRNVTSFEGVPGDVL